MSSHLGTSLGLEHLIPTEPYGPIWREERRLYRTHLNNKDALQDWYRPDIEEQAQIFVLRSLGADRSHIKDYDV